MADRSAAALAEPAIAGKSYRTCGQSSIYGVSLGTFKELPRLTLCRGEGSEGMPRNELENNYSNQTARQIDAYQSRPPPAFPPQRRGLEGHRQPYVGSSLIPGDSTDQFLGIRYWQKSSPLANAAHLRYRVAPVCRGRKRGRLFGAKPTAFRVS